MSAHRYPPGNEPLRFGEDQRRPFVRSHIVGLLLTFFVVTVGVAMISAALTCPC